MLMLVFMIAISVSSQDKIVKVVYNDKAAYFDLAQLTLHNVLATFKISEIYCLEDLSGVEFVPLIDGRFPNFISSEVYVRQSLPKQIPTVIYPSESKFVFDTGAWSTIQWEVMVGSSLVNRNMRIGYIQFKDLPNRINKNRKISKVYLRMVGTHHESILPSQLYIHRCETEWKDLIHWRLQPIIKKEPYTSIILREVNEISFHWDVTDIVIDWALDVLPNYGIAVKANNSYSLPTTKLFHNNDLIKRPCLLVFYSD